MIILVMMIVMMVVMMLLLMIKMFTKLTLSSASSLSYDYLGDDDCDGGFDQDDKDNEDDVQQAHPLLRLLPLLLDSLLSSSSSNHQRTHTWLRDCHEKNLVNNEIQKRKNFCFDLICVFPLTGGGLLSRLLVGDR